LLEKSIISIWKQLPDATIIVSTWKGIDIKNYPNVTIIHSEKLEEYPDSFEGKNQKHNSEIILTNAALSYVKTPYTLKWMEGLELTSTDFLQSWDKFPLKNPSYSFLKSKIIIPAALYRLDKGYEPDILIPFLIKGWTLFGLTDDLKSFWNVPFVNLREMGDYREGKIINSSLTIDQYLIISNVKKIEEFRNLSYKHHLDWTVNDLRISEKIIVNNFIISLPWEWSFKETEAQILDIQILPYHNQSDFNEIGLYTNEAYKMLYEVHSNKENP
jgi:hypothetical protein